VMKNINLISNKIEYDLKIVYLNHTY